MKKLSALLFSITLIIFKNYCFAQAPVISWQKTLGGPGNDIIQDIYPTADGNYIMLGLADSLGGDVNCNLHAKHDMWVIKMDPSGNIIWQQCYGGYKEEGNPNSKIIQTSDGGYLFETETWSSDGDVIGHHGKSDAWTVKLDSSGVIQWAHSFGGTDWDVPRKILELPGRRYLVMSRSTSDDGDVPPNIDLDAESFDAWVFIIDSLGNIITNNIYGGTGDDDLTDLIILPNGNYAFFGLTSSTDGDLTDLPVDSTDGWVLVTDTAGNIISNYVYGQAHYESFLGALPAVDGGFVAFGETSDPTIPVDHGYWHGDIDYWAVKLDDAFNVQWQSIFGGSAKEQLRRVCRVPGDAGYYMAGTSLSTDGDVSDDPNQQRDWWIVQVGVDGSFDWGATFGGSDVEYCYSMVESGIVVGGTYSSDGDITDLDGPADGWVVQLDIATLAQSIEQHHAINIYPNPANDVINVQADGLGKGSVVEVKNVLGQVMYSTKSLTNEIQIGVAEWDPGVYFLTITNPKDGLQSVKSFEVMD